MWVNITACRLFWAPEARSSHSVILQDRVGTLCRLYDSATIKIPSSGGTPYERGCSSSQGPFPPFTHPVGHSISTLNAIIRRCYYAEIALNNLFSFHTPDWIFRTFIFLIYDITTHFRHAVQCKISAVR